MIQSGLNRNAPKENPSVTRSSALNSKTLPGDSDVDGWVDKAPDWLEPLLRLSRYDRPVGFWLLGLPCIISMTYVRLDTGWDSVSVIKSDLFLGLLFMIGAIAMRGAGCTWNDFLDRKIDAQVARTAGRPLPAGRISPVGAIAWMLAQCLAGLCVLLCLPLSGQIVALAAIPMVALYPLMKRITWWPQLWLGLTFNWGVLVAAATLRGQLTSADLILFLSLALWTLGYDTIYALQDKEDDALIGVRSTARLFGKNVRAGVSIIYTLCILLLAVSVFLAQKPSGMLGCLLFAGHLALQAARISPKLGNQALILFKSNRDAAGILIAAWIGAAALS